MQYLERVRRNAQASWYAVGGDHGGPIDRYVVSTAGSRDICNRSELLGVAFNLALERCMTTCLVTAPFRSLLEQHPEERVCIINFLRGGLNFELRRALHTAYGFNRHSSAFMSSQRYREDGRWFVKEDMYRKLDIPKDAVLVMGDVVATGVTMENGLRVVIDHIVEIGGSVRSLVFFTIGCHKAEKALAAIDARLREAFPDYEKTVLVYLEGKFRLVDSKSELRIGVPGTDLIRRDSLLSPELEASQYDRPGYLLERCAIYDAGSRAFDIPQYAGDVVEYWEEVLGFAEQGWTLREALAERWPEAGSLGRDEFLASCEARWKGVGSAFLDDLYHRQSAFFRGQGPGSSEALAALCRERIARVRDVSGMDGLR
jgi:uracil phosphoribosyltransferase